MVSDCGGVNIRNWSMIIDMIELSGNGLSLI
jgi:hypothetical protein